MAKKRPQTRSKAKGKKKALKRRRATPVSWRAAGYPLMSPATAVDDCARAIDWYKKVLGARQRLRLDMPGGMVAHCELAWGDAILMMGNPMPPQFPAKKVALGLYVKSCDAVYKKALENGARSLQEPADQFYGDRTARIEDPFGNEWSLMTHIREVSVKEMKKAMAQMGGG